jgi:hypothetical protein
MIFPDGYFDVPAGKIAAIVTHLEMTEPSAAQRCEACSDHRVTSPSPGGTLVIFEQSLC